MTASVQLIGDAIEGDVLIRAAPDRVFGALTLPEDLMRWWGSSETYSVVSATVDRRVGGVWAIEAEDVRGRRFSIDATITRIEPPHLLQLKWMASWAPGDDSCVEIALTPEAGGTRLRVRHTGLGGPGAAGSDTYIWGWRSILTWAQHNLDEDGS